MCESTTITTTITTQQQMWMSNSKLETVDQAAAKARDHFVRAVWTGTLPRTIEDEMRSKLTPVGNFYDDLLSLDNQYFTALTVLSEAGFSRASTAPERDDDAKRTAIMIARSMVTTTEPDPEATP